MMACDACKAVVPPTRLYRLVRPARHLCDRCWRAWINGERPCAECGTGYRPIRADHRFCSRACQDRAYRRERPHAWGHHGITRCPTCLGTKRRASRVCMACSLAVRGPGRSGRGAPGCCPFCGTRPAGYARRRHTGREAWCCHRSLLAHRAMKEAA
jgi:hypothetical protein